MLSVQLPPLVALDLLDGALGEKAVAFLDPFCGKSTTERSSAQCNQPPKGHERLLNAVTPRKVESTSQVAAAAASGGLIGAAIGDRSRQQSTLTETSFQVTIEGF